MERELDRMISERITLKQCVFDPPLQALQRTIPGSLTPGIEIERKILP